MVAPAGSTQRRRAHRAGIACGSGGGGEPPAGGWIRDRPRAMPANPSRHRANRPVVAALALAVVALLAGSCGGEAASGPTLPSVDFSPKLVVELDDQIRFVRGPREDPAVTTDPASVPGGTVIEVVNEGDGPQRLQGGRGGTTFDTGALLPDERTTVVLTNDTGSDTVVALSTTESPDLTAEITVRPRPTG